MASVSSTPPQPCAVISTLSSAHIAGVKTSDTGTSRSPAQRPRSYRVGLGPVGRYGLRLAHGLGAWRVCVYVAGRARVRLSVWREAYAADISISICGGAHPAHQ